MDAQIPQLDYQAPALRPPLRQRINWSFYTRLAVLIGVFALIAGAIAWPAIEMVTTGGIKDAGGGYKEVDLKAMSNFLFDQNQGSLQDIPQKWRSLDGQKVVVYGEMWAANDAGNGVSNYDLCYSIAKCCFSGPPQVQHFVKSRPASGAKLNSYPGLVKVKGILHVNVKHGPEKVLSVYEMDAESIDPVQ